MCRDDEWGQSQTQTEEPTITEEDLESIKERETNIRQLEVDCKPELPDILRNQERCNAVTLSHCHM